MHKEQKELQNVSSLHGLIIYYNHKKNRGKITQNAAHGQGALALDGFILGAYHFQGFEHGNYKCDVVMVQIPDIQNLFSQKKNL